ncbi:MAG: HAD-IIA family hydrolase [Aquificaceae bacterium]|nr:HAD-IIA family hydrolase [Aquificaceae bacterium]
MKRPLLLLDMDGVLVKDKALNPFEDSASFLAFIRDLGLYLRILSNNSTRPPKEIVEKLRENGLFVKEEEFVSPLSLLGDYLREKGIKKIFFIGMPAVEEYLKSMGFELAYEERVDAVVIGQDRELNFKKLKVATSAVFLHGAKIVPVNLTRIVKDDDGLYFLGAGSVALSIAHACNYGEELPNLGKPSKQFIKYATKGLDGDETYLISDDIYTDLIGAKELGIKTVFMTTGKYKEDELKKSNFEPDLVFHSLKELREHLYNTVLS